MAKDKLNNVLSFTDHQANWSPVKAKKTKRTETGLDIINEYADIGTDYCSHQPFGVFLKVFSETDDVCL